MNEALSRLVLLIPERSARRRSGTVFTAAQGNGSPYRDQLGHLAHILHWMNPVTPFTPDDQRLLGVAPPNGRAAAASLEDDEEALGPAPQEQDKTTSPQ
jgi:hypothetical protein